MKITTKLLCLLVPLLAVQCRKEEEPDTALLPADFKALVRFEEGTYWVYQDSATQALDSAWVTRLNTGIGPTTDRGEIIDYREGLEVQVQHSIGGHIFRYGSDAACFPTLTNPSGCARLMRSRQVGGGASGGDPATTGYVLEYPLPAGQIVTIRNGAGLYLYRHTAPLPLGSRSYADVVQATNLQDQSENGATVTYYWAPHYGLVRRRYVVPR